jgi:hypothetical protein
VLVESQGVQLDNIEKQVLLRPVLQRQQQQHECIAFFTADRNGAFIPLSGAVQVSGSV